MDHEIDDLFDDLLDDSTPPRRHIEEVPPLLTQAELHYQWRSMMGELGFGFRRLWLLFLDREMRPSEVLIQIDDIPEHPSDREVEGLMTMLLEVQDEHDLGRVAILLSRPGEGALRPSDRQWGRALVAAARRTGVPLAPIHLADDETLVPLTGDDLLATEAERAVVGDEEQIPGGERQR